MAIPYTTTTVDIAQLDVDLLNPRGNPTPNQTEAMRELLAVEGNGEKVFVLALSICELGMLDPADRLYVVETSPNRYTVLDGNRRLTALRLLSEPSLVDREDLQLPSAVRNRFKKLQSKHAGRWPQKVDVVVFEDRESANQMIRLRHTGENEGAGRSSWSALQVARFDDAASWRAVCELRKRELLELRTLNRLDRGDFAITNFERVAGTEKFQTLFGISLATFLTAPVVAPRRSLAALARLANDVGSGRVTSRDEFEKEEKMGPYLEEVNRAVAALFEDSSEGHSGSEDRESHDTGDESGLGIHRTGGGAGEGGREPTRGSGRPDRTEPGRGAAADGDVDEASSPGAAGGSESGTGEQGKAKPKPKAQSKYLIDRRATIFVSDPKCHNIFDELKTKVLPEKAPYACALLLRSWLELTANIYAREVLKKTTTNAIVNLDATANDLKGTSRPGEPSNRLELAKAFATASTAYSDLSSTAHDQYHAISPDHVRATWSSLSGGMELIWRRITPHILK